MGLDERIADAVSEAMGGVDNEEVAALRKAIEEIEDFLGFHSSALARQRLDERRMKG